MGQLIDFALRTFVISALCSAAFGAAAGYALASFGRYSRVLGAAVGAILSLPGLCGLAVATLVRAVSVRRGRQTGVAILPDGEVVVFGGVGLASGDRSTGFASAFDSGYDSAPVGSASTSSMFDLGWDEPVTEAPVSEPAPLAGRPPLQLWARSRASWMVFGSLAIAVALLSSALFTAWLHVTTGVLPPYWFYASGNGLDFLVEVSLLLVIVSGAALVFRPYRWAAIAIASVADSWVFFGLIAITMRDLAARLLENIGAMSFTVGGLLEMLGVDTSGAVVEIPEGMDLSSLGITAQTTDLTAVDMATVIPDVTLGLGVAVFMLLASGLIANIAVVSTLRAAHRRNSLPGD